MNRNKIRELQRAIDVLGWDRVMFLTGGRGLGGASELEHNKILAEMEGVDYDL
jgi:hypothetical protein